MVQHEEERAEEQFVCHGVKVLAERGALLEPAGYEAVEAIGDSGEDEEGEGGAVVMVEDGKDQKRNDAQPQERELVGCGA